MANSRPHLKQPSVWRRRHCKSCGTTFTTYERPALQENKVVQHDDGGSRPYNSGKLIISIAQSFAHQPEEAAYAAVWLAQTVEDTLSTQVEQLTPLSIATVTHAVLSKYDPSAALQYALKHELLTSTRRRGRPSLA